MEFTYFIDVIYQNLLRWSLKHEGFKEREYPEVQLEFTPLEFETTSGSLQRKTQALHQNLLRWSLKQIPIEQVSFTLGLEFTPLEFETMLKEAHVPKQK